jgi:uncharacterized phage infection (PIP) family protein YhgE
MRENILELRKLCAEILRDEKHATRRLDDIVQKYRAVFGRLSARSKSLEEKLNHLMANRDEVQTSFDALQMNLRLTRAKIKRVDDDLAALNKNNGSFMAQYNSLLEGKLPLPVLEETADATDIKGKRELFMARLSETFGVIEAKITEVATQTEKVERLRKKLATKAEALAEKAGMEETKLGLYQNNIREILLEINNEEANVRRLADDYKKLTLLIKSAPDISAWGMKIFKEGVEEETGAGAAILKLGSPAETTTVIH